MTAERAFVFHHAIEVEIIDRDNLRPLNRPAMVAIEMRFRVRHTGLLYGFDFAPVSPRRFFSFSLPAFAASA